MSVYATNENGVQALKTMSNALHAAVEKIANHTTCMINISRFSPSDNLDYWKKCGEQ